jgi:hypothetical protein
MKKEDISSGEVVKRRPRGQPTKYTKRTVDKILKAIREGNTYEVSAKLAGISYPTLAEWRNKYPDFSEALKEADEDGERVLLDRIKTAGIEPKFWQANAWILERRFPDRWARRDRLEHTGKDGEQLVIKVVNVDGSLPAQD